MTTARRLDHVAILVHDAAAAAELLGARLGLEVSHVEESAAAGARLVYLDAGNAYIQLLEPLDPDGPLMRTIEESGEGLHHLCFGVDDVAEAASGMADGHVEQPALGSGRGRVSAFVEPWKPCGVLVELTEFHHETDVVATPGWLADAGHDD
jgi:methylmalonyl-CoA/ethylmalonyl-CoA epimerase